jgi:hypothetical protein
MTDIKQIRVLEPRKASILVRELKELNVDFDYQSHFELEQSKKVVKHTKSITKAAMILGFLTFFGIMLFQFWAGTDYYKMNIGNKPLFSVITALPYAFELAVLLAGISGFIIFMNLLRKYNTKTIETDEFETVFLINDADIKISSGFVKKTG